MSEAIETPDPVSHCGHRATTDQQIGAYLAHTVRGIPLREIARRRDCHASTILRQIRKLEQRRDDPLVDHALERAGAILCRISDDPTQTEIACMTTSMPGMSAEDKTLVREAKRVLRRLCEPGAFLVVPEKDDAAVVFKEIVPGKHKRIGTVERRFAAAFALHEWIEGRKIGQFGKYQITQTGRSALKRYLSEDLQARAEKTGFAEVQSKYLDQHREFGERLVISPDGTGEKKLRFNLAESPLTLLGRKQDRNGVAYLTPELVEAGERLREDFEVAQMGPRVSQNWDRFLTGGGRDGFDPGSKGFGSGYDARGRVERALAFLGPGLSDVALRCCCYLEGLENAEKRMGWSARSGKIVLRIALQRLHLHYSGEAGSDRLIG